MNSVTLQATLFDRLCQEVFPLDTAIQCFVLEEAGRQPRWAGRESNVSARSTVTHAEETLLVDPLLLMLAEGRASLQADLYSGTSRLRFIVLAYADLVQIALRLGDLGHISIVVTRDADAYAVGNSLATLFDRLSIETSRLSAGVGLSG